jgi:undecaprenyl-diphosphatase
MPLPLGDALIFGVVEGLTEFLPVSSTGHLIVTNHLLGQRPLAAAAAVDAYLVIIQLGSLLAAVYYYRRTYWGLLRGIIRGDRAALLLLRNLALGALPLLLLGYFVGKPIKQYLFRPPTVIAALIAGGFLMLGMDAKKRRRQAPVSSDRPGPAPALSARQALLVGLVQTLALWPGTSRSMSGIVGGQLAGLSTAAAADFTFLLALPTLGAATLYELLKGGRGLVVTVGAAPMAVGLAVAFAVGWLVIGGFLRYLRRFGLWPFGCYRIALGVVLLFAL